MLEQEVSAWLFYSILFGLFFLLLSLQSIYHRHILLFAVYSLLIALGHLYSALTHKALSWRDQDPVINQLPVFSIVAFVGIVDWQFVSVRFINTASKNYRRWGTLHPVGTRDIKTDEDSASEASTPTNSVIYPTESTRNNDYYSTNEYYTYTPFLLCTFAIWMYVVAMIVYGVLVSVFMVSKILVLDLQTSYLISAICTTVMTSLALFNFLAVVYTGIKCHSKEMAWIMRQNKWSCIALILIPLLFASSMVSETAVAWVAWVAGSLLVEPLSFETAAAVQDVRYWIVLKSCVVYLPLVALLICCSLLRKRSSVPADPFNNSNPQHHHQHTSLLSYNNKASS